MSRMPSTELPSIAELNMRAQRVAVFVDTAVTAHLYALAGLARVRLGGIRFVPCPARHGEVQAEWLPALTRYDPDLIIDLTAFSAESRARIEQSVFPFGWLGGSIAKRGSGVLSINVGENDEPLLPPYCSSGSDLRWPPAIDGLRDLELMILAFYGTTKSPIASRSAVSVPSSRAELISDFETPYDPDPADPFAEGRPTVLQVTDHLLTPEVKNLPLAERVVVVSETPDPLDFCLYWSVRATHARLASVLWLPLCDLAECDHGPFWDELRIARWVRPIEGPGRSWLLVSTSISQGALTDLARTLEARLVERAEPPSWRKEGPPPVIEHGDLVRAHTGTLDDLWPQSVSWMGKSQLRPLLARENEALCDVAFPSEDTIGVRGTVIVDFQADRLALAEGRDRANLYSDDPARVGPHGLSIAIRPDAQALRVRFPDAKMLAEVYFECRGFALRLGRKHMLAQRVIDSLGGSDPAGLLGSTPACLVLHKLVGGSWTHGDVLRLIGEEGADDPVRLLAALVNSGVLLRGFFTACEDCGSDLFLGLGDLAENPKCSICGGRCSVPVNAPWGYRLSSLFAEAVHEGVLLHAVTLLALGKHHLRGFAGLPGGVIEGRDREIDVLGFWQGKLVVCECKKAIGKDPLMVAELDGLVNLARDLNASKVFAVTLGTFSREVTRRAEASATPPVVLLEGSTLFTSGN